MNRLRLFLIIAVVVFMTAAIGAAPIAKRATTSEATPRNSNVPTVGGDKAEEQTEPIETPVETESIPDALVPYQFETMSIPDPVAAGATGGNPINMDWYSINNGGAIEVAAGNIKMGLSIGQNAVGEVSAGNIKMGLGFWYGAGSSSAPPCACDCHADPSCDSLTNVFDVAFTVNVAFRNDPAIPDPNPLCSFETTDVNCTGFTDIIDVALLVDVAFRNEDPAVKFCNPCALTL